MSITDDSKRRSLRERRARHLAPLMLRAAWLVLLSLPTSVNAISLRGRSLTEERSLQLETEPLQPYVVPLTLALHSVSNGTATALESMGPEDDIVYHFCRSVNEQAGGSQVRKSALEVGVAIATNFIVIGSRVDTQCTVLATNRVLEPGPISPVNEFFSMQIHLEQVIYASWNSTDELLLDTLVPLVENGFNRGRGGRVRFRSLLQESDAFGSVQDLDVISELSTPAPQPSVVPSLTPSSSPIGPPTVSFLPSVSPTTSDNVIPPTGESSSQSPSQMPSVSPNLDASENPTVVPSFVPSNIFTPPSLAPSRPRSSPPSRPSSKVSDTPSTAPTDEGVGSSSKSGLSAAVIAAIVCGAVAALILCLLVGFLCRRRPAKDDVERSPSSFPNTPSRGSRLSGSLRSTPRRSNLQGGNPMLSPVPDILHLDDDNESLAETTLGEHTAGRKPPRKKRILSSNSYEEESLYTTPSLVLPPPRVSDTRTSTVRDTLDVCLETEDERFSPASEDGNSNFEERDTTASSVCSSASSSSEEETEKSDADSSIEEEPDQTTKHSQSSSEASTQEGSNGDEELITFLCGHKTQIASSPSSSRYSRSTSATENNNPKESVTSSGNEQNKNPNMDMKNVPESSGSIVQLTETPAVTPTKGMRERSESSSDGTSLSNMIQSKRPKPQRSASLSPPGKNMQRTTPPFRTRFIAMAPDTFQPPQNGTSTKDEEGNDAVLATSSSDFGSSEGCSFLSSDTSKQRGGRRPTGAFPSSGAASVSSDSSDSSDGASNPWLYDAVESTLGPRSLSAELESLSGRSCRSGNSHRSHRSTKSQPSYANKRRTTRGRKHGTGMDSVRSGRTAAAQASSGSSLATELQRLESHLAKLYLAEGACSVSNASPSVANDSVAQISKASSTRSSDKQRIIVVVPPGKLGVVLANRRDGRGTVISDIRPTSPLHGKLVPGDRLVAVDGVDVTGMVVSQITSIMSTKASKERQLTVITSAKLRSNADTPQTEAVSTSESDFSTG